MFRRRRRERVPAQRIPLNLPDSGLAGRWKTRWLNHDTSIMNHAHLCAYSIARVRLRARFHITPPSLSCRARLRDNDVLRDYTHAATQQ